MHPLPLLLALASSLRFGPLPAVVVYPGRPAEIDLSRYAVSDAAETALAFRVTNAPGFRFSFVNRSSTLSIETSRTDGALPDLIVAANARGETAAARLPILVAPPAEKRIDFRYRPEAGAPRAVSAAGEFNGWNASSHPLTDADGDGTWETAIDLAPGRYLYKFVVDGAWMPDPGNPDRIPDGFGGQNTFLVVPGGGAPPRLLGRDWTPGRNARLEFVPGEAGGGLLPERLFALVDENPSEATLFGNEFFIPLPADSATHRVRVWAGDSAGQIARIAFDAVPGPGGEGPFDWRDAVIYFAFTDRFANGDTTNDAPLRAPDLSPRADYLGGDFAGIRQKIEEGYFERLGVNTIWISPHFDNPDVAQRDALPPNRYFSGYHGYWPTDSIRTESRFGSAEELRAVVEAAHARGIRILFDMVYAHVHDSHPLYREHPEWFEPLVLPDGRRNIRLFDEFPLTTWFDDFLPKVDYAHPEAVRYQLWVTRDWVTRTGVDGFRLDAVKHIPHDFWRALRRSLAATEARRGERFFLVGESIDSRRKISEYLCPAELDAQFDFPLYWTAREVLARGGEGFDRLEAEVARGEREYPEGAILSPLLGNHDVGRLASYADGDLPNGADEVGLAWGNPVAVDDAQAYAKIKMAFTFLFALEGAPMIYYGDEIGLAGAHDPDNRRPMRWGDRVTESERGVSEHVAQAAAARRAHPALRRGVRRPLLAERDRYAFVKTHFGDAVLVALRRGGDTGDFDLAVAPDLPDGTSLADALGSGIRARVENGRVRFSLPPMTSVLLAVE